MWRAFFLAVGITLILVGAQLFFVEQLEIKRVRGGSAPVVPAVNSNGNFQPGYGGSPYQQASFTRPVARPKSPTVLYTPREWMPWSLLAIGTVVVIYTFTIPRRTLSSE